MTNWTDDRKAKVRELVLDGHSCSEIAEMMGTTRNAISGLRCRLGLRAVDVKAIPSVAARRALRAKRKTSASEKLIAHLTKAGKVPRLPVHVYAGALNITFDQLHMLRPDKDNQCRYISGDNGMYCGHVTPRGQPWCEYHRAVVWRRSRLPSRVSSRELEPT